MNTQLWPWLLTAAAAVSTWMAGCGRREAWLVGLAAQGIWVAYAIITDQVGFLGSVAIYTAIYVRNWRRGHPRYVPRPMAVVRAAALLTGSWARHGEPIAHAVTFLRTVPAAQTSPDLRAVLHGARRMPVIRARGARPARPGAGPDRPAHPERTPGPARPVSTGRAVYTGPAVTRTPFRHHTLTR